MSNKYTLDGKTPVPTDDVMEWAKMFKNTDNRRVAWDEVGDARISTVFLGLDHSFGEGSPLLFETMVFTNQLEWDGYCERYCTWEEAETGHARILQLVKDGDRMERPH